MDIGNQITSVTFAVSGTLMFTFQQAGMTANTVGRNLYTAHQKRRLQSFITSGADITHRNTTTPVTPALTHKLPSR